MNRIIKQTSAFHSLKGPGVLIKMLMISCPSELQLSGFKQKGSINILTPGHMNTHIQANAYGYTEKFFKCNMTFHKLNHRTSKTILFPA